jgi:nitroimidazol reductase NimA-like FMN-containing flavoprotein (pyridoxamine 5'-phosphate oxidase superfamily)
MRHESEFDMITPLTRQEACALLAECRLGRLGCTYAGGPYVVPVNYVFDGHNIYVHSLPGRKLAALRANPKACLQVDEIIDEYRWRSAIAFGEYEDVIDPAERERAVRLLLLRFPQLTPVESVPVHDGQSSVVIFRIRVDEVTGVGEK